MRINFSNRLHEKSDIFGSGLASANGGAHRLICVGARKIRLGAEEARKF